ncbi:hypothetical protein MAPG_06398 [Magnaporthiopsis poae ATCC 64411]|uniref:Uncharacterized protein n=1 Tax=Magnaporthiopsis poae (strain ATCC 64411 / 73-15) TaxID=644358 RepID=A0A0C4E1X4_MAGP6|nr:hypothetical protein MAPG_06398 [Magnaporthiopsis poae ATCC 64411]
MSAVRQYQTSTLSQAAPEGALGRPANYMCPDGEDKNDSQGRDVIGKIQADRYKTMNTCC